ncbi:MAG: hypothetical protein ACK47B_10855 [Armatimonadota bacterium]
MNYEINLEVTVTADEIRGMVAEKVNNSRMHRLPFTVKPEDVDVQPDGTALIRCQRQAADNRTWWAENNQLTEEEKQKRGTQ